MNGQQQIQQGFDSWALVEVMGHKRYAGRVTEHVIAGQGFVRVDVPEVEQHGERFDAFTKLIGAASIYAITPVSEQIARGMAQVMRERPVHEYDLPKALPAPLAKASSEPALGVSVEDLRALVVDLNQDAADHLNADYASKEPLAVDDADAWWNEGYRCGVLSAIADIEELVGPLERTERAEPWDGEGQDPA